MLDWRCRWDSTCFLQVWHQEPKHIVETNLPTANQPFNICTTTFTIRNCSSVATNYKAQRLTPPRILFVTANFVYLFVKSKTEGFRVDLPRQLYSLSRLGTARTCTCTRLKQASNQPIVEEQHKDNRSDGDFHMPIVEELSSAMALR